MKKHTPMHIVLEEQKPRQVFLGVPQVDPLGRAFFPGFFTRNGNIKGSKWMSVAEARRAQIKYQFDSGIHV